MSDAVDLAIVRGGIAGLSAAVACHQKGIRAHVFEAAEGFSAVGTSLTLWPNAMQCLNDWGLGDQVSSAGRIVEQLAWRRLDGRPYFEQPLTDIYAQLGLAGYCVRRADLHAALVAALPAECLHLNQRLLHRQQGSEGVVLSFQSGEEVLARHVIAADGVWSVLRQACAEDQPPRYAGYGAWLGLSSAKGPSFAENEGCEYIGDTARLGVFQTGQDTRYWFLVAQAPEPTKRARMADVSETAALIQHWPDVFQDLI